MGLTSLLGLAVASWTAKAGVNALMTGPNIAYREKEDRGLIEGLLVSWALTIGLILFMAVALGAVAVVPFVLDFLSLGQMSELIAQILRWPIAIAAVIVSIGLIYRVGSSRRGPAVAGLSSGAVAATLIWADASAALSVYVSQVSDHEVTYGALRAIVVPLLWFWTSALAILLGAKLNAEMKLHASADTTRGKDRPIGKRCAYVEDHIAGSAED